MGRDFGESCQSEDSGLVRRRPPVSTERRRKLLALAIDITDMLLKGSEPNERELLFRMIEQQFSDVRQ